MKFRNLLVILFLSCLVTVQSALSSDATSRKRAASPSFDSSPKSGKSAKKLKPDPQTNAEAKVDKVETEKKQETGTIEGAGPAPSFLIDGKPFKNTGWLGQGSVKVCHQIAAVAEPDLTLAWLILRTDNETLLSMKEREHKFQNEVKILRYVESQRDENRVGIIKTFGFGNHEFFQEELNKTVWELLKDPGATPLNVKIAIFLKLAVGLANLHGLGIAHRDLSAVNMLLSDDNEAKISDFSHAEFASNQTAFIVLGFPENAAPEFDKAKVGLPSGVIFQSDVFSFGVVMYQLLFPDDKLPWLSLCDSKAAYSNATAFVEYQKCKLKYLVPFLNERKTKTDLGPLQRVLLRTLDPNPKTRISSKQLVEENKRIPIEAGFEEGPKLPEMKSPGLVEASNCE